MADMNNAAAVNRAWKHKIRAAHPDRNRSASATAASQRLNEAKDCLLRRFGPEEQKRRDADEEREARDRQTRAEEAAAAEKLRAEREALAEKLRAEQEALAEKLRAEREANAERLEREKAVRHANQVRNRRKRAEGARVHASITSYAAGRDLVAEMRRFVGDRFQEQAGAALPVREVLALFLKSRERTSELETNLFKRHAKRLFLAAWPASRYASVKHQRCFLHVGAKQ